MSDLTEVRSNERSPRAGSRRGVAVIGMACMFPGAPDVDTFWHNILHKVDAVSDPPPEAWDTEIYYDPDFNDTDKVYCKRGGYLGSLVSFDPLPHNIPPMSVGGEPDQWLALQLARDAMADANCLDLPEPIRQRTAVILGKGTYLNGGNAIALEHGLVIGQTLEIIKRLHPEYGREQIEELRDELKRVLPPMSAETVPGLIPNIIVGRIANRLDLMGPTYTVDAACASSLVAVELALRDLESGAADLALVGGSQVWIPVPALNVFCRLNALSRREKITPFDKDADGTLLGEGIGMMVLKRLEDAERDGDRIYSVIKGIGVASDGRGTSVMAPRIEGEELALRRAYQASGLSPETVDLIEAHGTATPVGDVVEVQALTRVFGQRQGELAHVALGTVKSMISHTIPAAGIAGLIKTSLALYHKVLPPTINVTEPNPKLELEQTPFYLNTETRPWVHGKPWPRRAGVNAFGFGGINAHVVLEEYLGPEASAAGETLPDDATTPTHPPDWSSELVVLEAGSPEALRARAESLHEALAPAVQAGYSLKDIAYTLNRVLQPGAGAYRLALIADSIEDLGQKLERAAKRLADPKCRQINERGGIYYTTEPLARQGKLAFLFPGEGSQYPNMLADLCLHFPEVRAAFDRIDRIYFDHPRGYVLSDVVFPRPTFSEAERAEAERRLMQMDNAIEAVLTANAGMLALTRQLGIEPDAYLGHSTGEYSAMIASGALDLSSDSEIARFSLALNRAYETERTREGVPTAVLLAIGAAREQVEAIAREAGGDILPAMDNCPHQTVLVGEPGAAARAVAILQREGLIYEQLTFDRAYHTRLFEPYSDTLRQVVAEAPVRTPAALVYSCTTSAPYPADPAAIRELMIEHWHQPVEFRRTIEHLYDEGYRLFVEVGARGNLTAFVEDILRSSSGNGGDKQFRAIPADTQRRDGITQFNHLIGTLLVHGVRLDPSYLYRHREPRLVDWEQAAAGEPVRRSKVDLFTSWPMLKLSEEFAAHMRAEAQPRAAGPETSAPADVAPGTSGPGNTAAQAPAAFEPEISPPEGEAWLPVGPAEAGVAEPLLADYLETMDQFLDVQQTVMQAYLLGASVDETPPGLEDFLASSLGGDWAIEDREADPQPTFTDAFANGHDSWPTQRPAPEPPYTPSQTTGSQGEHRAVPPEEHARIAVDVAERQPRPAESAVALRSPHDGREVVAGRLLDIVSERTGYPAEMLAWDLDLEADLGIDSIKRVEILGTYRQQFGGIDDSALEQLANQRTLRQILDVLSVSPSEELLGDGAVAAWPLLGEIAVYQQGQQLVARRTVDLADDRYLLDHTLGRDISVTDPELSALPVMPLTMSFEILAEAAACLLPGRVVIGLSDVLAYRWLTWDTPRQTLEVSATRLSGSGDEDRVRVRLRNLTEDAAGTPAPASPTLEATVILADRYPEPPAPMTLELANARPSSWQLAQLYREVMFHGPRWQGVIAMGETGDNGTRAGLRVLPFDGFFARDSAPRFVLDPVVLDAAGQVIGFWTAEHLAQGKIIFPFRLEALEVYGPQRPAGEELTCAAAIQLIGPQLVSSDIEVSDSTGRLWLRLVGWQDKRFELPAEFEPLIRPLESAGMSEEWPAPIAGEGSAGGRLSCRRVTVAFSSDRGFWKRIWADRVLSRAEREDFIRLRTPEPRQLEWLAGRTAAKEAVLQLLAARHQLALKPADIEIRPDADGRPVVGGAWLDTTTRAPLVSIAHSGGTAAAVAWLPQADDERYLGIDIERGNRAASFDAVAFDDDERRLLDEIEGEERADWSLRAWCAKEAVVKALGEGLVQGPKSARVTGIDRRRGVVLLMLGEQLAARHPELAGALIPVEVGDDSGLVFAFTRCNLQ